MAMKHLSWLAGCVLVALSVANVAHARPDRFARGRADIDKFCRGDGACVQRQRGEMAYFETMVAAFPAARHAASHCMRHSKIGKHVIWTRATPFRHQGATPAEVR